MGRRVTNGLTGNVGSSISSLSVVDNSLITVTTNQNVVIDQDMYLQMLLLKALTQQEALLRLQVLLPLVVV